jgi:hypothetical protein
MRKKDEIKLGYIVNSVDWRGDPKSNTVWIEIEENAKGFSLTGHINYSHYGQIDDEIMHAIKKGKFEYLLPKDEVLHVMEYWQKWHLNDMIAGCEHHNEAIKKMEQLIKELDLFNQVRQRKDEKPFKTEVRYELIRDYLKTIGLHHCAICNYDYGTKWLTVIPPAKEIAWIRAFKQKWEGVEIGRRTRK